MSQKHRLCRHRSTLAALALGGSIFAMISTAAAAQTTPDAATPPAQAGPAAAAPAQPSSPSEQTQAANSTVDPTADAPGPDIIVTGSHIQRPGFESPTPVTSLGAAELKAKGVLNVNQLQYQIPALVPNTSYQSVLGGATAGAPGASTFNLRGLGPTRTLLLVDGRRVMPTSFDGTTDANILPVSLISRVDTVTGGASAAYGSDAVAGVVNIILDTEFTGLRGKAQVGTSRYGDNREVDLSLAGGTTFGDGRGHVVLAGEYYHNGGASFGAAKRPYLQGQWALISNPLYTATNGQPKNVVADNMQFAQMTTGGLIDSGPLRGTAFGPGGVPFAFTYGTYASTTGTFMQGGSGDSLTPNNSLSPLLDRKTLFGHTSFEFSPAVTVWAEASYTKAHAETPVTPNYDNGGITIRIDNPFLPASIVTRMQTANVTSFVMGRLAPETGYNLSLTDYDNLNIAGGLKGHFLNNWTYALTGQWTSNIFNYAVQNNRNNALWLQAIDVVTNPANGQPICRSTLANPSNGCVPTNIFGPNSITPAMASYFLGTSTNYYNQKAWDFSLNIQGVLLHNWAGDVSVAFGGEARHNSIAGSADTVSLARGWRTANILPFTASQGVKEGYVEVDLPLLKDSPIGRELSVNGAFRLTNYDLSGNAETWKVGVNYQVTHDLRLRGTKSRDIRAPNLNDLFMGAGSTVGAVNDPLLNQNYSITQGTGGNRALVPEVGMTTTVGAVYSPSWFHGFQISLDYYKIDLNNAISSPGTQGVVDGCYIYHEANFCNFITRDPVTNRITFVLNTQYNASTIDLSGFDFEAAYSVRAASALGWALGEIPGNLRLRAIAGRINKFVTTNANTSVDTADTGNLPKWKGIVDLTYASEAISLGLTYRYTGPLKYSNIYVDGIDINDNHIGARSYVDLNASWSIPGFHQVQLFGVVRNLFNVKPPVNTEGNIAPRQSVSQAYDVIGQSFTAGVRFNF